MNKNYKILTEFIKDMSCETPDVKTFLFVKDNIAKYSLHIDINSSLLKNKIIEINTVLKFEDKNLENKRSHFDITYTTIIKIEENIKDKKKIEKIVLCEVPSEIYPRLENAFLALLKISGFPGIKFGKKINFEKLYNERLTN